MRKATNTKILELEGLTPFTIVTEIQNQNKKLKTEMFENDDEGIAEFDVDFKRHKLYGNIHYFTHVKELEGATHLGDREIYNEVDVEIHDIEINLQTLDGDEADDFFNDEQWEAIAKNISYFYGK